MVAQADSKEKHVKDLAVVLGTETVTVILDDTISVWPEHQHNLMQVKLSNTGLLADTIWSIMPSKAFHVLKAVMKPRVCT